VHRSLDVFRAIERLEHVAKILPKNASRAKGSGSIRLGESSGVVLGVRAEHKRSWVEGSWKRPITIVAKITEANLTGLVVKGLSGVDAGQLHPRRPETGALPQFQWRRRSEIATRPATSAPLGDSFGNLR
jgi:hypothetical protein